MKHSGVFAGDRLKYKANPRERNFSAAMALESSAVFEARVMALKLGEFWPKFRDLGWTSVGEFAFAANCTPGQQDEATFISDIVIPLTDAADHPKKSALRRLFYECFTQCAADMAARSTQGEEDDRPKKLPKLEREVRMSELRTKLSESLDIEGETEPSNTVIDKAHAMFESGEIRALRWDELTTRESESGGVKSELIWKIDKGVMRQSEQVVEDPADTSTELKLRFALQRRGVAYHVGKVMSFKTHEKIVKFLMKAMNAKPLPLFAKVSLEQVYNADQAIFVRAGRLTPTGISIKADGSLPLDAIIPGILEEHSICCLVQQMPSGGGTKRDNTGEIDRLREEVKRLKSKVSNDRSHPQPKKNKGGKGGNGGKGGQGKKVSTGPCPPELAGLNHKLNGMNLCFAYNSGKCSRDEDKCLKGLHKCMVPFCAGDHSAIGSDGRKCAKWKV